MKKLFLILLLGLSFSCGKQEHSDFFSQSGKIKVLSTTAMIDDIVGMIGGEEIDHLSLIVGDLDPHSYELLKGDDEKLSIADLIFFNGLGLEHGASLRAHLESHRNAIGLGDLIYQDHPQEFVVIDGSLDPHFWMDIALFSKIIDPITQALSEKAPTHGALFHQRGEKLKELMHQKDVELEALMQSIPEDKRYLVASHDAFFYFTKKYLREPGEEDWKKRFMAPEGLAPEGQMSFADIQRVSEFLCAHRIPIVFPETNINQDGLRKIVSICREKGLHVTIARTPLYGDTMGSKGTGADSYLQMIEHNVRILASEMP